MFRLEAISDLSARQRADIVALVGDVARHTGEPPLPDHIRLALEHGDADPIAVIAHADGVIAGYAQAVRTDDAFSLGTVLARDLPADVAEHITAALVDAACTRIADAGGGEVSWWIADTRPDVHDCWMTAAAASGFRLDRTLLQLRVDLPLAADTVELITRAFVPGIDEQSWLEVNNAAFEAHPEQGRWSLDTLLLRERQDWFDPTGILMHDRGSRLAGFCWTKVHRETEPMMGEIYVIAVHPDFHGLGLGRALAVKGLAHIAAHGIHTGMLYVDAANTPAITLYRSLGFTEHHRNHAMVGGVAAVDTRDHTPIGAAP